MLSILLNWLGGGVLKTLTDTYVKLKSSEVESERIKADVIGKQIEAEISARQAALQVRLSTSGFWEMRLITAIIAGCFTLHLVLVTLDTCFGFGWRIAKFPPPFDEWEGAILLSFFGVFAASKGVNALAAAFIGRR